VAVLDVNGAQSVGLPPREPLAGPFQATGDQSCSAPAGRSSGPEPARRVTASDPALGAGPYAVAHCWPPSPRHETVLVSDLGFALQQLGGEHDLVAKGGSRGAKIKEVLLDGDGVHAERRLLVLVTG